MVDTGIHVNDDIIEEFGKLRMKRAHRFMIMKHSDDKLRIEIEHIGSRESTFNEFKELMPKDMCRYILIRVIESV